MNRKILTHEDVLLSLPDRAPDAHKGDFGRVLLLCGSRGYTGAAALAAMGALRTGSGLVSLGVPESIYVIEAVKLTEAMVFPLPEEAGMLSEKGIPEILKRLEKVDAVLVGCGLGQSQSTFAVTKAVLENARCPVVLDADGINVMAEHKNILYERQYPTVLTPHPGEFQRLFPESHTDPVSAAESAARSLGCVMVLKGHETVITDAKECYINQTGNPGMAVGGSGDLLAGMIVSLIGQGLPITKASAVAVWLHGAAGDLCAREMGQYGMLPSDMVEVLPRLMK